jgi:Kef-type K+ transport system membrane component KefB
MFLLYNLQEISFPLTNPILKFMLILVIILFAPILLNKLKIPHLLGLIIAGAVIGPFGFNLMERDSSIVLSGTAGLLYIMFLAGLEIDLEEFKKNSVKSLTFGLYTFLIPMILGILGGIYLLHFNIYSSILLASMFASHTLIAYPIISKMGVVKNRAVNIAVGGTMITDTLALLVLAIIVGMTTGVVNSEFWLRLSVSITLFALIIMLLFPLIGRWFFKRYDDSVAQYIFVLVMVFLGATLAELAGIEAIIGAFLAGLALNKLIPSTSPLMNRIEFVGNAIFIPFFLIGVGMLVNYEAFIKNTETIKVALIMTVTATLSKFLAAWVTQKTFKFNTDERRIIFGLSNAQAAATLAAVLVGYNIILNQKEIAAAKLNNQIIEPVRLLNESVLNGTILMILITCTIATFIAQKGAKNIALAENIEEENDDKIDVENILIPLNNIEHIQELVGLGITIKSKQNKENLYGLNIIKNGNSTLLDEKKGQRILNRASSIAAATDNHLKQLLRYDVNIVNGISGAVKEHKISDIILGLHDQKGISDSFLGNLTEGILTKCTATTFIFKPSQPLSTIKRHLIIIPEKAELENGFALWLLKIWNIGRNTGANLVFYGSESTLKFIKDVQIKHPINCTYIAFNDWNDFLIISRDIKKDDNMIIVMARKDSLSYQNSMSKIPSYLNKYFIGISFILVYPIQYGINDDEFVTKYNDASILEPIEKLDEIGKTIARIFKRK